MAIYLLRRPKKPKEVVIGQILGSLYPGKVKLPKLL